MKIPSSINNFVEKIAGLPGIGPRQALRIAFHLVYKGEGAKKELEKSVKGLESIKICSRCFYLYEGDGKICDICSDKKRNHAIIAILEKPTDLISIENTS